MEKIKEELKEKLKQGLKKISKQALSSDKLTKVSGGDGVKEYVLSGDAMERTAQEIGIGCDYHDVELPDKSWNFKAEVKDGVLTLRWYKEIGADDLFKMAEEQGLME